MGENENILFILQDELEYSLAALQQIEDQRQEAQIKHEACKAALELELEAITVERDALLRDRQERGHEHSGNVQDVQTMKILHDDLECSLDALECLQEQHENLQKNREAQEAATKYDMEVLAAERDALLRERQERNKAQESSVALDLVKNSEALRDARKVCASRVRYKKQLEAKKKEKLELEIDLASKISTVVALEEAKRRSLSEPTTSENTVLSQGLRSYVENCTSCPSKTVNIDIEATEKTELCAKLHDSGIKISALEKENAWLRSQLQKLNSNRKWHNGAPELRESGSIPFLSEAKTIKRKNMRIIRQGSKSMHATASNCSSQWSTPSSCSATASTYSSRSAPKPARLNMMIRREHPSR